MMSKKKKRFDWDAMDQGQKLGYAWLLLFIILILSTAATILYPAYKKWTAEEGGEKKGSLTRAESQIYASTDHEDTRHGLDGAFRRACEASGVSLKASIG